MNRIALVVAASALVGLCAHDAVADATGTCPSDPPECETADLCLCVINNTVSILGEYDYIRAPNEMLDVRVYADTNRPIRVEATGDAGIRYATVDTQSDAFTSSVDPERDWIEHQIPSRGTGAFDVVIKDGSTTLATYEFVVEERFTGALRMGIGLLTGATVERSYGVDTVNGSNQSEIVLEGDSPVAFEIVLGYAQFLESSGRSYALGRFIPRFAPWIGVGVLQTTEGNISSLQTFYLGIEAELGRSFSIAPALAIGRTERLRDGYHVGSAIAGDEPPTVERYRPGFGIVFNLTPDFFKFAGVTDR